MATATGKGRWAKRTMLGWAGRQPKGTGGEGASIDDKNFACCCSGAAESVGYSASAVAGMPWSRSRPATRREAVTSGTTEYRRCVQRYMGRPGPGRSLDSRLQARPELAEAGESEPKRHATSVVAVAPQSQPGWDLTQVAHIHVRVRGQRRHHPMPPLPPATCPLSHGRRKTCSYAAANRASRRACFCVEARRGEASNSAHCLVESGCHWEKHDENKSRQLALAQWSGRLEGAGSPCLARIS